MVPFVRITHFERREMFMDRERVVRFWHWVRDLEIPLHGAHTCYFLVLSAFPALVLTLGLLRYTGLNAEDLMDFLAGFLPQALQSVAQEITVGTFRHISHLTLSASALVALWSAGRGIYGLMKGLDAIYGAQNSRGWLKTRLICALYTLLFLLVLILTLVAHVFGTTLLTLLESRGIRFLMRLADLRFFLLVGLQTLLFGAMYRFLPQEGQGLRGGLPGALLASLGWMTVSAAFSWYVEHFTRYSDLFGSVYTIALAMLWLYLCVCIVFYGAVFNRILEG